MMTIRTQLLVVCLGVLFRVSSVYASPFTSLIVFGDSLSDGGASATAATSIFKIIGGCDSAHPCPPYAQGHYANGAVAAEYLANALLQGGANPANFVNFAVSGSTSGLGNFGDGGTQTGVGGFGLPGMAQTVKGYTDLLTATASSAPTDALFLVWGGANDFLTSDSPISAALNIANYVSTLASFGAHSILVPNIPDLSQTPFVQSLGTPAINLAKSFTLAFNQALATDLALVNASHPGTQIFQFDTFGFFNGIAQNPAAYGFNNTTDACVHLPSVCSDPATHVFWDAFHPTTQVHALLASAMASQVPLPGSILLFLSGLLVFLPRKLRGH